MIKRKRMAALVMGALLAVCMLPVTAFAEEATLTIDWKGEPASGAEFDLYRVADMSENGTFALAGDFEDYSVELDDLDSDGWRAAAKTLAGYAEADGLATAATGKTDGTGTLTLKGLENGLYLGIGRAEGNEIEPFLVALPGLDDTGVWDYDVSVEPKYTPKDNPPGDETVSCKVLKVWKDDDDSAKQRPKEVTIQLVKDGKEQETVKLNAENNWKYEWEKLDADAEWSVVEKNVPTGYTVTTTKEGKTYVVTNTYKTTHKTPKTTTDTPKTTTTSNKLPRTGQLWWPVPILAVAGIVLFSIGWLRRQRG